MYSICIWRGLKMAVTQSFEVCHHANERACVQARLQRRIMAIWPMELDRLPSRPAKTRTPMAHVDNFFWYCPGLLEKPLVARVVQRLACFPLKSSSSRLRAGAQSFVDVLLWRARCLYQSRLGKAFGRNCC